jgi:hypothetical protein
MQLINRVTDTMREYSMRSTQARELTLLGTHSPPSWEVLMVWWVLLRVVRQADYVAFWALVGLVSWCGRCQKCIDGDEKF